MKIISVPIRGLFNLTIQEVNHGHYSNYCKVSVPIRGLFNLTLRPKDTPNAKHRIFPSPSGDYLI